MSTPETRALVLDLITEAVMVGTRVTPACAVLGLTPRTLRRWRALAGGDSGLVDRRTCTPRIPANRLSPEEQEAILTVCNEPEYRSLPPTQIVPRLADQGRYIASESSFYRVLRAHDQVHRRGRAAAPRQVPKPEGVCATAPNAAWCWDITFLASSIRGQFYRLYLIEDLFSRKIVGWEVHAEESAAHASRMIEALIGQKSGFRSTHAAADRHPDRLGGAGRGLFRECSRSGIPGTADPSGCTNGADRCLAGMAGRDGSWCGSGTSRHVRFAAGRSTMGGSV
jgi:transposase InsO family protein